MSIINKIQIDMRKNYIIYIFIFIPILCTSCDWFNPTRMQNEDNFTKLEGVSPALKQHLKEEYIYFYDIFMIYMKIII